MNLVIGRAPSPKLTELLANVIGELRRGFSWNPPTLRRAARPGSSPVQPVDPAAPEKRWQPVRRLFHPAHSATTLVAEPLCLDLQTRRLFGARNHTTRTHRI